MQNTTRLCFLLLAGTLSALILCAGCNQKPAIKKPAVNAGVVSRYAEPGVYQDHVSAGFYVVRLPLGELVALDVATGRLGCRAIWLPNEQKFMNACTNGLYSMEGINESGPDPCPLKRYKIYLSGKNVIVDSNVEFRQELGDWNSPDSHVSLDQLNSVKL